MKNRKILKSIVGASIIEILITLSLMSVVTLPAYMSLINGYRLFHNESAYQTVLSDVQLYLDQMNSRIRIAGFKDTEVIKDVEIINSFGLLSTFVPLNSIHVFRVGNTFYYAKNGALYSSDSNVENLLFDNLVSFVVEELEDGQIITINITIGVNGRQETIQTRVYDRY